MSQAAQSQLSEGCTPGEALGLDPANTAAPEARDITYDQRGQPGLQRALNSTSSATTVGPTAQNEGGRKSCEVRPAVQHKQPTRKTEPSNGHIN